MVIISATRPCPTCAMAGGGGGGVTIGLAIDDTGLYPPPNPVRCCEHSMIEHHIPPKLEVDIAAFIL